MNLKVWYLLGRSPYVKYVMPLRGKTYDLVYVHKKTTLASISYKAQYSLILLTDS